MWRILAAAGTITILLTVLALVMFLTLVTWAFVTTPREHCITITTTHLHIVTTTRTCVDTPAE